MKLRQLARRTFLSALCAAIVGPSGGSDAVAQVTGGSVSVPAVASPPSLATVTLRDGTLLKGRISSLQNGLIRLETRQLGTLNVPVPSVQSIIYSNSGSKSGGRGKARSTRTRARPTARATTQRGGATRISGADLQGLMQFIAGSPDLMRSVAALQKDPEIQGIVRDPAIQRAVTSGNLLQLMKNPKILNLLRNQKIKGLTESISKQYKR